MPLGEAFRPARVLAVVASTGIALATSGLASGVSAVADEPRPHVVFHIDAARITESSSLVRSTVHPRLLYTANDSGDGPFVYVLNSTGRLVGTTTLLGVDPVDVEAMASGDDGSLIVADVGDNDSVRASVQAYRIAQPGTGSANVQPQKVSLTYADGPHNAESVLYDAASGRIFVVSKAIFGEIYESPPQVFTRTSATLRPVASAPSYATDATFLAGHAAVVIRTYRSAVVYAFPSWKYLTSFALPPERQGESVTSLGTRDLLVGSEGDDSPVWLVPLPAAVLHFLAEHQATAPPTTPPTTRSTAPGRPARTPGPPPQPVPVARGGDSAKTVVTLSSSAAVLVVVAGAVVLLARRRRRRPKSPTPSG